MKDKLRTAIYVKFLRYLLIFSGLLYLIGFLTILFVAAIDSLDGKVDLYTFASKVFDITIFGSLFILIFTGVLIGFKIYLAQRKRG